jgi:hypothetical protein
MRLVSSRLYFPPLVAHFVVGMRQFGLNSLLAGLVAFSAIQQASGGETNDLPHFQEILRLLRANLPNVNDEELNRAAVQGLLSRFYPRVILVTNDSPASPSAETPLISKATTYDKSYGYLRVAQVATGLAEQIRAEYEKLNSTNKIKGLVLDLRFADGQDFTAAANAADKFLSKEQPLISWEGGSVSSTAKSDAIDVPVGVLIHGQTAGAAEALAAVLRETAGSVLIGARTAGQAHVFKEFNLTNGQRLRIATGQVQVAKGKTLSANGVAPDIEVRVESEEEKAYFADAFGLPTRPLAALRATNAPPQSGSTNRDRRRVNEAELVRLQREGRTSDEDDLAAPGLLRTAEPSEPIVRDPALARALDLLKGLAIVERTERTVTR